MRYIIKEDEKVVVAIMEGTEDDVIEFLYGKRYGRVFSYIDLCKEDVFIKDRYVGIAKCHPKDEFDVEKGKQIAKLRARLKHDKDFNKKVQKFLDKIENVVEQMRKVSTNKEEKCSESLRDCLK